MKRKFLPLVLSALLVLPIVGCQSKSTDPKVSPKAAAAAGDSQDVDTPPDSSGQPDGTSEKSDKASGEVAALVESEPIAVESGDEPWIEMEELPWEADFLQFVDGRRIGYTQLKVEPPTLPGSKQLAIQRFDSVEFLRAGKAVRVTVQLDAEELFDGRLLSFTETTINGEQEIRTTGKLTRGYLKLTTNFAGTIRSEDIRVDLGTWGILGLQAVLMKEQLEPGKEITAKYYAPSLRTVVDAEITVLEPEETALVDGSRVELLPVDVVQMASEDNGVRSRNWVDSKGQIQKTVTFSGMNISWFRTTRDVIERIRDGYRLRDEDLALYAPVSGQAETLADAPMITYMVEGIGVDPFVVIPTEGRQKVQSATARRAALFVADAPADRLPETDPPKETAIFLSASVVIDSESDALKKQAKEWVGEDNQDALSRALRLADGLSADFTHVAELHPELRSTYELLKQKDTDAVEASCLLAAMLRSQQIPSRCVGGLLLDIPTLRLNYHAWTEAWIDNKWVGLDPTLGGQVGSRHVKIVDSPMNTANPLVIALPVLDLLPNLQFTVSSVTPVSTTN